MLLFVADVSDHVLVVVVVNGDIITVREWLALRWEDAIAEGLGLVAGVGAEHLDMLVGTEQFRGEKLNLRLQLLDLLGLRVVIPDRLVRNRGRL